MLRINDGGERVLGSRPIRLMNWRFWTPSNARRSDMEVRARRYGVRLPVWQTRSSQSSLEPPDEVRRAVAELRRLYEADDPGDAHEPVPAGARHLQLHI